MKICSHNPICRFSDSLSNCKHVEICKHFSEDEKSPKGAARCKSIRNRKLKKGAYKYDRKLTTSDEDINIIRHHLRNAKDKGKLNENQISALKGIGSKDTRTLTLGQKEQLLKMYRSIRSSLGKIILEDETEK